MLPHPLYHHPPALADVPAMCTDANRMEAMASRATTAWPCVHVLTLPHARVDKAGGFIRLSLTATAHSSWDLSS